MLDRVFNETGIKAMRNHVPLVRGTLLAGRLGEAGLAFFGAQLQQAWAERSGEGKYRARIVNVLVDQLIEEAHLRAGKRFRRHQRLLGKRLIQVIEDY